MESHKITATNFFQKWPLINMLGWLDIQQRYRRSVIGPFWLTISMALMIGMMGIIFGMLFKANLREYLPFLAAGIIIWGFISSVLNDACGAFIAAEHIIKQLPIPLFVHIFRVVWRSFIIFAHNIIIFPIVLLCVGHAFSWLMLLSIIGIVLLIINIAWVAFMLAVFCTRYRDFQQIISNLLQIIYFVTPIMWMPQLLENSFGINLVNYNPVYHLLEIVRAPLLGQLPSITNWMVSIGLCIVGWLITLVFFNKYKNRIAYWL